MAKSTFVATCQDDQLCMAHIVYYLSIESAPGFYNQYLKKKMKFRI